MYYSPSELIINDDGSVFHLHLKPGQLAHKVILVGDPGRVETIVKHFDTVEVEVCNREFHSATGTYQGKRISAVSTGIGCDNIDIVLNELDALVNIDFNSRTEKNTLTRLEIVRIGTCGGLHSSTPVGTFIASVKSIGFDGLLNYYAGRNEVCDTEFEEAFTTHMNWQKQKGAPYVAVANPKLVERIASDDMVRGYTVSSGGFYGPQGRKLRASIADPDQNAKLQDFSYEGMQILNLEMESSAIAGLAGLLGHSAMTCCMVIANREDLKANTSYKNNIDTLITKVLDRI